MYMYMYILSCGIHYYYSVHLCPRQKNYRTTQVTALLFTVYIYIYKFLRKIFDKATKTETKTGKDLIVITMDTDKLSAYIVTLEGF